MQRLPLLLSCIGCLFSYCHSFYIPGWSPHTYRVGDRVPLYLNKVSSERTHLPYAYSELQGVCKPKNGRSVSLNLGEILRGVFCPISWLHVGLIGRGPGFELGL